MAPKKKGVKAAAKAMAAAQDGDGPQGASQMFAAGAGFADSDLSIRKRRRLQRRVTDERVQRALIDHFSHMPKVQLETKVIKGKTLRQRIADDIHCLEDGARLGSSYWSDLQVEWAAGEDTLDQLLVTDPNVNVSAALITALQHAHHGHAGTKTAEPLVAWLTSTLCFNQ